MGEVELRRLLLSVTAALAVALAVGSCQREDTRAPAVPLPARAAAILSEMNALGNASKVEESYRYRLLDGCRLEVDELLNGRRKEKLLVPLADARYEHFEFATGLGYALRLKSDPFAPELFRSPSPESIGKMEEMIVELASACDAPAS